MMRPNFVRVGPRQPKHGMLSCLKGAMFELLQHLDVSEEGAACKFKEVPVISLEADQSQLPDSRVEETTSNRPTG